MKLKTDSILKHGNMNDDEFIDALQKAVAKILADSSKISIENMSKIASDLGIDVRMRMTPFDKITQVTGNIPEYKIRELPLQGNPLKELSKL